MIKYIEHDVTDVKIGVIMHGCNAQGVMGSGVAKAIRSKFPIAYERYKRLCDAFSTTPDQLLGLAQLVNVGKHQSQLNSLFVSNGFTQLNYGKDGVKYADPLAINKALQSTCMFARGVQLPIYMPRIGCGLGGLIWEDVEMYVDINQKFYDVEIIVCDHN